MAAPRVIKTHVPCKLLLGMNGCTDIVPGVKIIIISRNPLDACVSRYYHAFNPYKLGWPFPAWAAVWLSGNSGYGSWFTWVRDWYEAAKANSDQVLWIQYEDMQKNSYDEIEKIRNFLSIQNDGVDNFDLIKKVAEGCSFDSMKEQSLQTEITGDFQGHLRKGVTGDWRNHFTPEMKKEFDDIYEREMSGSGLVYDFGGN